MVGATTTRVLTAGWALLLTVACSGGPQPEAPQSKMIVAESRAIESPAPGTDAVAETDAAQEADAVAELSLDEVLEPDAEALEPMAEAPEPDAEALLDESLVSYETSGEFWGQGAFDDAFAALDHAYELMARVPSNGDPMLGQEKENLRHLISRRVVEIYASRQTAVGDPDRSIPRIVNEDVQREIESFQGRERQFFLESYQRSGLYRPMIVEKLREAGLPEQISWLPLVESGFKVRAYSRARALGLWQFIPSTGYRYGLERDTWIDERMDPVKATEGAIGYLTALHNLFGDWLTAMAAYNCGERNVQRAIDRQSVSYFDQFWDLYQRLPRETRRYVPRFLAVLEILDNPTGYGFELPEPFAPLEWETVEIAHPAQLEQLDQALGLGQGALAELNPELRRKASPDKPYTLRVPPGSGPTLLAAIDSLPRWQPPRDATSEHRVRSGETLSGIAARYGTTVNRIMSLNRLRSANRISPGQRITVPVSGGGGGGGRSQVARADVPPGTVVRHTVRRGDSLWLLAARYGTTVDRIRQESGLGSDVLQVGQVVTLTAGGSASATESGGVYTVRRGDTLGKIATSQGVSLSRLLAANNLTSRSTIYPGQQLTIPN